MLTYNINNATGDTLISVLPAHKVGMYDNKLIVTIDIKKISDADYEKLNNLFDSGEKFIFSAGWAGEESGGGTEYEVSETDDKSDYLYDGSLSGHIKIYEFTVAKHEKWSA